MAIVSIAEGYTGVEAGGSMSSSGMKRTATRVFSVVTDDPAQGAVWSFPVTDGSVTIPAAGTAHPDDAAMLSGVAMVTKKGPRYFEVKVPYETSDPNNPSQQYADPLEAPAEISWDDAEYSTEEEVDLDNKPFRNSLGEPVNEGKSQRSHSDPVLIIERNQASFDPDDKLTYQDTICSEVFWGAAVGKSRMGKIKARSVAGLTPYWRVRYEITFRMNLPTGMAAAKAWWRCVPNKSRSYRTEAGGKLFPTLDGHPTYIRVSNGVKAADSDTDIWLYFREYLDHTWAALGLNT